MLLHFWAQGKSFSADQLVSLVEFLPTSDEADSLTHYISQKGDICRLGNTDKFMVQMMGVPDCRARFKCLTLQKHFPPALRELSSQLKLLERACDDVMSSSRLKKLFSVILLLGNKLNAGSNEVAAFTIDSLNKLKDAKAFDKKTSVMKYLVQLLQRQDPDTLDFRKELSSVPDASQISSATILGELESLEAQLRAATEFMQASSQSSPVPAVSTEECCALSDDALSLVPYCIFTAAAAEQLKTAQTVVQTVQGKYDSMLSYFGEDPELGSETFFQTLDNFSATLERSTEEVLLRAPLVVLNKSHLLTT